MNDQIVFLLVEARNDNWYYNIVYRDPYGDEDILMRSTDAYGSEQQARGAAIQLQSALVQWAADMAIENLTGEQIEVDRRDSE